MADYKEGVDYEMVLMKNQPKGGTNKTRRFFTKAEKAARNAPKAAPVKAKAATPTKATKAAPKPTQDAMKGYRKGDVTTAPIGGTGGRTPPKSTADIVDVAKKGIDRATMKRPTRPITPTRDTKATGRYSGYETARLGNITEAQWDALTPAQREAKGLPVSWMDYIRSGGDAAVKKAAPTRSPMGNPRGAGGGYAKGGMVKKKQKGKC